jgi:hypothetical protein
MILGVLVALAATGSTRAAVITYTETATGSGTFHGIAFTNALITLVGTGDTANITNPNSGLFLENLSTATVTVDNLGTGTFTGVIHVFSNQGQTNGGLSTSSNNDILDTINAAFASYALATSFGPVSGSTLINSGSTYATTLGNFSITSITGNGTFSASSVPEPSTYALLSLMGSVGGLVAWRRKRAALAA